MNANKSATANFIQAIKITVNKVGQGSVSPGTGVYPRGGTRTFTATAASGWRWDHWEGAPSGQEGDASLDLPMDQSRTITAHFIERATLTMVKTLVGNLPAEGGSISPGEGETKYDKGQVVSLSATPASGWRFAGWSGGGTSGDDSPINVTMSGDKTVTATFIQRHTVTAESQFHGIVTPESGTWDHGQSASFAWEKEQWLSFFQFTHWAGLPDSFTTTEWGAGTSDQETVNFTVNDSYHLIAYDENVIVLLTAEVDADGCTECTVDPTSQWYIRDTEATVTATPDTGWVFIRWEGDVPEGKEEDNPLVMTMDENKDVTAVMKEEFELTIDKVGEGTVDPDVGTYTFLDGETATVSATAADEWVFSHWSGLSETDYPDGPAGPGTSSEMPLKLVMVRDESITANFVSGCLVMWPPGSSSSSELMAVSALEPETESELVSITFTSDLNALHDDDGTFTDVGELFTEPEFIPWVHSHPILCAMDSTLTAMVSVVVTPAGIPFTLIGEGPDGWSTFEGTGVSTGEQQVVSVTADAPLPHALAEYNPTIDWRLEFCTEPQDLDSTHHRIYSTYGLPQNPSEPATAKRIDFLLAGIGGTDCDVHRSVGRKVADTIASKFKALEYPKAPFLSGYWSVLDDDLGRFECVWGRRLAVDGLLMLGISHDKLRWTAETGCQAHPSTDHTSGVGYNSNCVDVEEPNYCSWVFIGHCFDTPLFHPAHLYGAEPSGKVFDDGLSGAPSYPEHWVLRFGTGAASDGGTGSAAENFFKIQELNGEWYYISVVPPNGPHQGSDTLGDELDKAGRYNIMKDAQGTYTGQHWFDNSYPASPLP